LAESPSPIMNSQRILVVEDDGIVGRDLQETLVRHGYSVPHVAPTGERAVELVGQTAPDLVLMDISLGGELDGIDAAELIQGSHGTPVIYITGGADDATQRRAQMTGPYGYLVKPFAEADLLAAVEGALERYDSIQRLEASERRFVSTLKSITEGVISTDLAGNITFVNPVAERLTGWSSLEACGRPLGDVFLVRDAEGGEVKPLPRGGDRKGVNRSVALIARDGTIVPIEDSTAPIKDDAGGLTGLVVVFRRSRHLVPEGGEGEAGGEGQAEADGGDEQLVQMVESIVDPMFTMDADWRITYVNSQATGYFGRDREAVIGRPFWDDFNREVREEHLKDFTLARETGKPHTFEMQHEVRGKWFLVNTYPFADGVLVLFRDITEQKRAEEGRAKMEKLEDLGFLARGFAHDFNNLLTVLVGNLSLASTQLGDESEVKGELQAAKGATEEAQNLVQQLLTFAKGGAPIKKSFSLWHLIEELVGQHLRGINPKELRYRGDVAGELREVRADRGQIRRLFENLIRNAEQASYRAGEITLECGNLSASDAGIDPADVPYLDEQTEYVVVRVIDRGHGIPEDLQDKVFEPYFSTKEDANASGLGLTVCESIIKAHGGALRIDSREDEGTIVSVYLPAGEEPSGWEGGVTGVKATSPDREVMPESVRPERAGTPEGASAPLMEGRGRPRILVLEDEPLIRELIAANLSDAGYEVEQTAHGEATVTAYRLAMEEGRPFDLVLMDLSIPEGMGGAEAIRRLREMNPKVLAVVSSGYSNDPVMAEPERYGFSAVLPKPYDPAELRDLVVNLLSRGGSG
jgi:two-component system cell cycle sensor histidine kinase/response regulator CckA